MKLIPTIVFEFVISFLYSQKTDTLIPAHQEYQKVFVESIISGTHTYKVTFKHFLKADTIIKDVESLDTIVVQNESKNINELNIRYTPAYNKIFSDLFSIKCFSPEYFKGQTLNFNYYKNTNQLIVTNKDEIITSLPPILKINIQCSEEDGYPTDQAWEVLGNIEKQEDWEYLNGVLY